MPCNSWRKAPWGRETALQARAAHRTEEARLAIGLASVRPGRPPRASAPRNAAFTGPDASREDAIDCDSGRTAIRYAPVRRACVRGRSHREGRAVEAEAVRPLLHLHRCRGAPSLAPCNRRFMGPRAGWRPPHEAIVPANQTHRVSP